MDRLFLPYQIHGHVNSYSFQGQGGVIYFYCLYGGS